MRQIDPVRVRILMLKKGVRHKALMRRFRVSKSAISKALTGERKALLERIYEHLKTL